MNAHPLVLEHDGGAIALTGRAVSIGRLFENDVVLEGWEVSRRHARIVPTPAGPVLVDRSRYGTFVNQQQVVAPLLLAEGDQVRIGRVELTVTASPRRAPVRPVPVAPHSRLAAWFGRYGWSEVGGVVALLVAVILARRAGTPLWAAALVGTLAETAWFYLMLALQDLRYERRERLAAGRRFDARSLRDVLQNLAREFGAAEGLDLLLRPLCLWGGLSLFGTVAGTLGGKLAADILFYGPVLAFTHWRLAGRAPEANDPGHLRATTAVRLPVGQLAELARQQEEQAAARERPPIRTDS